MDCNYPKKVLIPFEGDQTCMEKKTEFKTAVCLFTFKRSDSALKILDVLSIISPQTLYLFSDGPRTAAEAEQINKTREELLKHISWPCKVVKRFNETNKGVFSQIALGALEVLSREQEAIFLEDDNLPDVSFFSFCQEMLSRYRDDPKIMMVYGTNYLGQYQNRDSGSYLFTQQLLPCGWASWYSKFSQNYDAYFSFLKNKKNVRQLKKEYKYDRFLFPQQKQCFFEEIYRFETQGKFSSWDYQLALSLREHHLYAICPKVNLIKNIGVDLEATHGGEEWSVMTKRFCSMGLFSLPTPYLAPSVIAVDPVFEKRIAHLRKKPFWPTLHYGFKYFVRRKIFHLADNEIFWKKHRLPPKK